MEKGMIWKNGWCFIIDGWPIIGEINDLFLDMDQEVNKFFIDSEFIEIYEEKGKYYV